METIIVKKTKDPEKGFESEEQLLMDTIYHIDDVKKVLNALSSELIDRGDSHDWSKLEYFNDFAQDTLEREKIPDFKQRNWYNIHATKERHHINSRVPEDVNLIDVLEMIVDCCVAGKTRSGTVDDKFLIISDDVLNEAYWNTVKMVKDSIQV